MADSPLSEFRRIGEGELGTVAANENFNKVDPSLGGAFLILDRDLTAPPGGESEGDCYIVAAGATGAWAGQDGKIAAYYNGYVFIPMRGGMMVFLVDEKLLLMWSSVENEFFPVQDVWTTTELFTGTYDLMSGRKLYQKSIDFGALPAIGPGKSVPHNITSIQFADPVQVLARVSNTTGSQGFSAVGDAEDLNFSVNATSVVCINSSVDFSAFNNCYVKLIYAKQ